MSKSVIIESLSTGHADFRFTEHVILTNISNKKIDIDGWAVLFTEIPTNRKLHQYIFRWPKNYFFEKEEKLFLFSGLGRNKFYNTGKNRFCVVPHWQIFTNSYKHICSVPHVKVTLYNKEGNEIDHLYSHQFKKHPSQHPAIVIGHGGNPIWHHLHEHLRDQQGFDVETFETEPRVGHTIPNVIASLGDKSNMAILIMTGEDKTATGDMHPRLNVVQELGKFQERFGANKTIILAEKGVTIPSNNSGIVHIPFDPGQIKSTFGDVVATIRREFKLW